VTGWNRQPGRPLSPEDNQEAIMSDHWRTSSERVDVMRGTGEDDALYATGWTISGLATLGAIVAVWMFGI
jgi:hypothetical protein